MAAGVCHRDATASSGSAAWCIRTLASTVTSSVSTLTSLGSTARTEAALARTVAIAGFEKGTTGAAVAACNLRYCRMLAVGLCYRMLLAAGKVVVDCFHRRLVNLHHTRIDCHHKFADHCQMATSCCRSGCSMRLLAGPGCSRSCCTVTVASRALLMARAAGNSSFQSLL